MIRYRIIFKNYRENLVELRGFTPLLFTCRFKILAHRSGLDSDWETSTDKQEGWTLSHRVLYKHIREGKPIKQTEVAMLLFESVDRKSKPFDIWGKEITRGLIRKWLPRIIFFLVILPAVMIGYLSSLLTILEPPFPWCHTLLSLVCTLYVGIAIVLLLAMVLVTLINFTAPYEWGDGK